MFLGGTRRTATQKRRIRDARVKGEAKNQEVELNDFLHGGQPSFPRRPPPIRRIPQIQDDNTDNR